MKTKNYYVSYQFQNRDNKASFGFGSTELELTEAVRDYTDINAMRTYIEERLHADQNIDANVVILYWRPFEGQ